ncbi:MAG TPA: EF-hand domain-containing protein [Gemmataceae bacterium]|nr:EF-hand domain-containing protein [Gemmataceae bacterium]
MKRMIIRSVLGAAFALLMAGGTSALRSAGNSPVQPKTNDDVQEFVFLAEARPLLVRLHVRVDGKPLPAVWDDFMKHLFAYLDVNGDGVLSKEEAERAPQLGSMSNNGGGVNGFLNATAPNMKELDSDKNGKVSMSELSAYYRKKGFQQFQFQLDMSPPRGDAALALYLGGSRPDPEVAVVSKAIFALLDTDKDGRLTQKELDAAPALLLARDENEDEIISAQELVPEEKPKGNSLAAMMSMAIPKNSDAAGNRFVVPITTRGEALPEFVRRMQERYDPSAQKAGVKPMQKLAAPAVAGKSAMKMDSMPKPSPTASQKNNGGDKKSSTDKDKAKDTKKDPPCKLTRKQLGLDEATFASLDANKDGVLDNKEVAAFVKREPDLCLVVSFGDKADKPLNLADVTRRPAALNDKLHVEDAVSMLDLGTTRMELRRGEDKKRSNRYMEFVKPQFTMLFKSADKDNNGYLDEKEAKKSPIFGNIFKQMDRDGDGKVTEKEMLAYFDDSIKLEERARESCVTLVLRDQSRGLFDLLDSNRDGKLGVREINRAPKLLARLDRQGKGYVRWEDLPPSYQLTVRRGSARPGGTNQDELIAERLFGDYKEEVSAQRGPAWFRKMDRNRDGDVSRKEFLFSEELFRKIDTDGDGLISLEEAEKAGDLSSKAAR